MSGQIGVRMQPRDIRLLKEVCKARGEDVCDFARRAIRMELARLSFLTPEEKKALGFEEAGCD